MNASYDAKVMVGRGGQGFPTGSWHSPAINADFAIIKIDDMRNHSLRNPGVGNEALA